MHIEDIRINGDEMLIDFLGDDGVTGETVELPKGLGFDWLKAQFHTVSLSKVKGKEVWDYVVENLKEEAVRADIVGEAERKAEEQQEATTTYIKEHTSVMGNVSTWFYPGTEDVYLSDPNAKNIGYDKPTPEPAVNKETGEPYTYWTLFGPKFRHSAAGNTFMEQLEAKHPGPYYTMIQHDKAAKLWDLFDLMVKTGEG